MWSSSGRSNNNNSHRVASSRSKSSSTCSSPSPFTPSSPATNRTSMEEVWKDISLSCLHEHDHDHDHDHSSTTITTTTTTNTPNHSSYHGSMLQDFLARPFNKDPPTEYASTEPSPLEDLSSFGSLGPPLVTTLSLNSGSDFQYLESGVTDPVMPNEHLHSRPSIDACSFGSPRNSAFEALGVPSVFPTLGLKRPQEHDNYSDDRRHKRMIKNRESAARSRARKQAYTNELENEVAHLMEENAKLRRQQEKLLAAPAQLPKKRTLSRTSTAPF